MNKETYFKISETKNLPSRCPLLSSCQRRAFSIYLVSYARHELFDGKDWEKSLIEKGDLNESYSTDKIEIQGEEPGQITGGKYKEFGSIHGLCPEVGLFDSSHRLMSNPTAWVAGDWDKETRGNNKITPTEYKHYSECAEFCNYSFHSERKEKNASALSSIEIKKLIANGNIEAGIQKVLEQLKDDPKKLLNSMVVLKSDYQRFRNNELSGVLDLNETSIQSNKIVDRLLKIIDEL